MTAEGTATFGVVSTDGTAIATPMYQGDLTGTLDVHFEFHATANNAGVTTANAQHVSVTCS